MDEKSVDDKIDEILQVAADKVLALVARSDDLDGAGLGEVLACVSTLVHRRIDWSQR